MRASLFVGKLSKKKGMHLQGTFEEHLTCSNSKLRKRFLTLMSNARIAMADFELVSNIRDLECRCTS